MSLLPPPALMSWVTCQKSWYLSPKAAYTLGPELRKAQRGDPLRTGGATGPIAAARGGYQVS